MQEEEEGDQYQTEEERKRLEEMHQAMMNYDEANFMAADDFEDITDNNQISSSSNAADQMDNLSAMLASMGMGQGMGGAGNSQ